MNYSDYMIPDLVQSMNSIFIDGKAKKLFCPEKNNFNIESKNIKNETQVKSGYNNEFLYNLSSTNLSYQKKPSLEFNNLREFNINIIEKESKRDKINRMKNDINLFYLENRNKINNIVNDNTFEELYNIIVNNENENNKNTSYSNLSMGEKENLFYEIIDTKLKIRKDKINSILNMKRMKIDE